MSKKVFPIALALILLLLMGVPTATALADDCPGGCPDTSFIGQCVGWVGIVVDAVADALGIHINLQGTVGTIPDSSPQTYRIRVAVDGVAGYQCSTCNNTDNVTLPTGTQVIDEVFTADANPDPFNYDFYVPYNTSIPHTVWAYVGQTGCANCARTGHDETQPPPTFTYVDPPNCEGWWGLLVAEIGGEVVYRDYQTGQWLKPDELETVTVTFRVEYGNGEVATQEYTFVEPAGCDEPKTQCHHALLYPMSIYEPANPPQSYWHGPFDFHACAVIHKDDQIPSADRVTMVCSLCPDQIEGGFIFNALNKPYTGYLYKVTCGDDTHYEFVSGDETFRWKKAWVRDGFQTDGERCGDNARVAGCSEWVHEEANIPYWDPLNPEGSQ